LRRSGSPGAKRLGGRLGAPYLLPIALTLAAGAGIWLLRGRVASLGTSIAGPDTQIRQALANQTRAHLSDVYGFRSGGTVELWPVRFADVVTSVERDRATVVAMLDAEGRAVWRDQAAALS